MNTLQEPASKPADALPAAACANPAAAFRHLGDGARLWTYILSRPLNPQEVDALEERMAGFIAKWAAHGSALTAASHVWKGVLLLIAVDEQAASASGCSIDALTRHIRTATEELGVEAMDRLRLAWQDAQGKWQICPVDALPAEARHPDTLVAQVLHPTVGAFLKAPVQRLAQNWAADRLL